MLLSFRKALSEFGAPICDFGASVRQGYKYTSGLVIIEKMAEGLSWPQAALALTVANAVNPLLDVSRQSDPITTGLRSKLSASVNHFGFKLGQNFYLATSPSTYGL